MSNRRSRPRQFKVPTTGLQGDYTGSCVVCGQPTDTGLQFVGEAEFAAAGLLRMGVPENQAGHIVSAGLGCEPGKVPTGRLNVLFRVCRDCADRTGFRVGLIAEGAEVPGYVQPVGIED